MMKLSCQDLDPSSDCNYEAMGGSESEVVSKMMAHIRTEHFEKVKGMPDISVMSMLRSRVYS